jgi:hypothetical protein
VSVVGREREEEEEGVWGEKWVSRLCVWSGCQKSSGILLLLHDLSVRSHCLGSLFVFGCLTVLGITAAK